MQAIDLERRYCAPNYAPLPVTLSRGEGVWVWDESGRRYLDFMSAYSALSHGHAHPRLVRTLAEQAQRLAISSRAFHTDRLGAFMEKLCQVTGLDMALPMNTGAEAVETAIKAARRWAYRLKKVRQGRAEIIVADGNFHGRTTTIISFSMDAEYQADFGPFTPGFRTVPFGVASAVEAAITPDTAAVLIEPIQGEAGIRVPPKGYLREIRATCNRHNVLLLLDEIQSGLGRTGKMFAFEHEGIRPDGVMVGKALGGGLLPVSAFVSRREVLSLMGPGSHGSTFGGNPLAASVGLAALEVIEDEQLIERSARLGRRLMDGVRTIKSPLIREVRGMGLWVGIEIDPAYGDARELCLRLMEHGLLTKETHETVVRLAPPLTIEEREIDWALQQLDTALHEVASDAAPRAAAGGHR